LGRFINPDPLQGSVMMPQSMNPYSYGMNNPYLTPDPTGLSPLSTPDFGAAFTSAMSSATNAVEGFVNLLLVN
jgi:hypothetical protein